MTKRHNAATTDDMHRPYRAYFADAAARAADSTTYTSDDIGALAHQSDTNAVYILTATTPVWTLVHVPSAVDSVWVPVYPNTAGVQPDLDVIAPFAGTVAISRYYTGTAPAGGTAGVTVTNTRDADLLLDDVDAIAGITAAPVALTVANADVQAGDLLTLSVDYAAGVTPAAAADGTPQSQILFVFTFTGA